MPGVPASSCRGKRIDSDPNLDVELNQEGLHSTLPENQIVSLVALDPPDVILCNDDLEVVGFSELWMHPVTTLRSIAR